MEVKVLIVWMVEVQRWTLLYRNERGSRSSRIVRIVKILWLVRPVGRLQLVRYGCKDRGYSIDTKDSSDSRYTDDIRSSTHCRDGRLLEMVEILTLQAIARIVGLVGMVGSGGIVAIVEKTENSSYSDRDVRLSGDSGHCSHNRDTTSSWCSRDSYD